jgi:hypothetical protein
VPEIPCFFGGGLTGDRQPSPFAASLRPIEFVAHPHSDNIVPAPKGNKFAVGNKGGRPSKYRPEYDEQAEKLCRRGANEELAEFFGVDTVTIHRWGRSHPNFARALWRGKTIADAEVAQALYESAVGYDSKAMKVDGLGKQPLEFRKYLPSNVRACIFWLTNRRPDLWRRSSRPRGTVSVIPIRITPSDAAISGPGAFSEPRALPAPKVSSGATDPDCSQAALVPTFHCE